MNSVGHNMTKQVALQNSASQCYWTIFQHSGWELKKIFETDHSSGPRIAIYANV